MSAKLNFHKASVDKEIALPELESLIGSSGGLIHRVDQSDGRTVVFFSGDKGAADAVRKSLSQRGKADVSPSTQKDVLKIA